jgi:hypothetical protein
LLRSSWRLLTRGPDEQPDHRGVTIEGDPAGSLSGFEIQWYVHNRIFSGRMRERLAHPLKRAHQAGCVRPAAGQPVSVETLAHAFAEIAASLHPATLGHASEDRGGRFCCARQRDPGHRRAGAGINRPAESLECGLAGCVERITDLLPAMVVSSRLVNSYLQASVCCHRQLSRCADSSERVGARPSQLHRELGRCVEQGNSRRFTRAVESADSVKIGMTSAVCQFILDSAASESGSPVSITAR